MKSLLLVVLHLQKKFPRKNFQGNKEARKIPDCQYLIQKHIFTEVVDGVSRKNRKLCKIISEGYLSVVT